MKISLSLYAGKYSQVIRYEKLEFVSSIHWLPISII